MGISKSTQSNEINILNIIFSCNNNNKCKNKARFYKCFKETPS